MLVMTLCAVVPSPPYVTSIIAPNPLLGVPPQAPWHLVKSNKSPKANVRWNVTFSDMPNTEKQIVITKQKNPNISTVANVRWGRVRLVDSSPISCLADSRVDSHLASPCLYVSFFWPIDFLYFDIEMVRMMIVVSAVRVVTIFLIGFAVSNHW